MKEKKPPKTNLPSKTSKIRSLKDEDIAIWGQATEDVTKFAAPNINKDDTPKRLKRNYGHSTNRTISGIITLETFGSTAPLKPVVDQSSSFQIDAALKKRFERGELPIEGHIDLHGLTLVQAHHRFIQFIAAKIKEGARFLLVITGKGGNKESGEETGVIRKNLPLWCEDKSLKPHILQITHAHIKHGGKGASYILLRRQK